MHFLDKGSARISCIAGNDALDRNGYVSKGSEGVALIFGRAMRIQFLLCCFESRRGKDWWSRASQDVSTGSYGYDDSL